MKLLSTPQLKKVYQGFTLIELIVVIAILGILAVGLLFAIDPIDKINSANDASAISFVTQIGNAEDTYAATHNNSYAGNTNFSGATSSTLNDLMTSGEIKSNTPPSNVSVVQILTASCTTTSATTPCKNYVFYAALQSDKNTNGTPPAGGPYYMWANGKGCYITAAQKTALTPTSVCP